MPEHPLDECPNAVAPLWPCNQQAIAIYAQVGTPFVADFHLGEYYLRRLTGSMDPHEHALLMRCMAIMHRAVTAQAGETDGQAPDRNRR